eukprot:gnl/MRDRNA2_/MRDRNA2_51545_c0_seq1.p1 gnl/MRDRNA2_/MRDRNA2_51545_c0~~gnl/MRDRNA2_/MRDRNA2_51545_c0_seq1.p1  ORF type:complete len:189 (+),score=20.03 gnl/MRDRNA2_/MRDRNA2_51545_c0_seq1:216-782(+)
MRCPSSFARHVSTTYEISEYRLGGLFFAYGVNEAYVRTFLPYSIGAEYIKQRKHKKDYEALKQILDSRMWSDLDRPDEHTVVIHFRGYDALIAHRRNDKDWEQHKNAYVKLILYYYQIAKEAKSMNFKKAVIVTGDHALTQNLEGHAEDWCDMPFTKAEAEKAIALTKKKIRKLRKCSKNQILKSVNG